MLARLIRALLLLRQQEVTEWQQIALAANRSSLDLAVAFRIALERPEVDIRDDLDKLILDFRDQVSKMEEHVL